MPDPYFYEFDLQALVAPDTTLGEIESVISSDFHEDWTWVIVEGRDDVRIYEPFFNPNTTIVRYSIDENKHCGCANVENIVAEILRTYYFDHIIGIRDTDYTRYDSNYSVPENIFLTDDHDIEMQMLSCDAVIQGLKTKKPNIEEALAQAYDTMKQVGYLRAYSISIQCGFNFDDYVKMANFWDQDNNNPIDNWKKNLYTAFFSTKSTGNIPAPSKGGFYSFLKKHNLKNEPLSYICQGHDVVKYLQWTKAISDPYRQFCHYYNSKAFSSSTLYSSIDDWQNKKELTILTT